MIGRMKTGRFIYVDDMNVGVEDRVRDAADKYSEVTGNYPTLAIVNPYWLKTTLLTHVIFEGHEIEVIDDPMIQKKIIYIGIGGD
jgi:hypothetical protein